MTADELKNQSGTPDFAAIQENLNKALECANTKEERLLVNKKISIIKEILKMYQK